MSLLSERIKELEIYQKNTAGIYSEQRIQELRALAPKIDKIIDKEAEADDSDRDLRGWCSAKILKKELTEGV